MLAVEIDSVSKSFGSVAAVERLSLGIPEGSIFGLIGPNGSGKTTTMRMIVNMIAPDSGAIRIFGRQPAGTRSSEIGYLPEERGLYRKMEVSAVLEFFGEMRGARRVSADVRNWLDRFELSEAAHKKVDSLSKGMGQKVQFIAAVVPRPRLLILDEPFTGLDPVSARVLREAVLDLRSQGTTVILSTHDMTVAEAMCDGIGMVFRGRKVLDGTLESIQAEYGNDTIRLVAEGHLPAVSELPGVETISDLGRVKQLRLARGADPQIPLRILVEQMRVTEFAVMRPSLEEIFIRIAGPQAEVAHA
jgi:ABC-2 type transport system ATP-binding protein